MLVNCAVLDRRNQGSALAQALHRIVGVAQDTLLQVLRLVLAAELRLLDLVLLLSRQVIQAPGLDLQLELATGLTVIQPR